MLGGTYIKRQKSLEYEILNIPNDTFLQAKKKKSSFTFTTEPAAGVFFSILILFY